MFMLQINERIIIVMDLSILNKEQYQAVETVNGPLLVLAGAGSGKTRVLTYRIANLIEKYSVAPWHILALTFTNKAAKEMRERTEQLLDGVDARDLWVMTFHSFCVRVLRMDIENIGYDRNFTIYDDDDQINLINTIMKKLEVSDEQYTKRLLKNIISDAKNKAVDVVEYLISTQDNAEDVIIPVYKEYEKALKDANALDFDDLILKTLKLFESNQTILEKYRNKFRYVLVDEYQDTNGVQYNLLKLLCMEHKNICVVGDDDQSIYGWRGADINNIHSFEKDFKGAKVIRLEQNYRSTNIILDAANNVIDNNIKRMKKHLWTAKKGGEKITLYTASSEHGEAKFICDKISNMHREGRSYNDFAIIYRANAQSRKIETMLSQYGIPHNVYGGTRFYDRKEIRDIIAYLRILNNPADDMALRRIINVPKRAIGDTALKQLSDIAEKNNEPLLMAAMNCEELPLTTRKKISSFADMIALFIAEKEIMKLSEFVSHLIETIEYEKYLLNEDKKGEFESRMENIHELIGNIKEVERDVQEGEDALALFLENVALVSDTDSLDQNSGCVSLMTLHSAKGLEFPVVFIAGMEETIFPSSKSIMESNNDVEEERRLCYVGITRAKEKLFLTNAKERALFGNIRENPPSRFIDEIPENLIEEEKNEINVESIKEVEEHIFRHEVQGAYTGFGVSEHKKPTPVRNTPTNKSFTIGERVNHAKFGDGNVLEIEGSGNNMMVTIDFDNFGTKRFAAAYAPIKSIKE